MFEFVFDIYIWQQELRAYMLKYGGRFANYFSRHQVTHIICSNLPDSKIKNLRFTLFLVLFSKTNQHGTGINFAFHCWQSNAGHLVVGSQWSNLHGFWILLLLTNF